MQEKIYECICGQTFNNPQKFNGHKQGCRPHIIQKYGSYEEYLKIKNRNHIRGKQAKTLVKEELDLTEWISDKHICEKCGIIMTEKFGSGRFCSKKCSNSHIRTEESKQKTSKTVKATYQEKGIRASNIANYNRNPNHCKICGKSLEYKRRNNQTCGNKCCTNRLLSEKAIQRISENGLHQNVIDMRYKYGTYKGFQCDSSWELAFVLWALDNHLNIERNTEYFEYLFEGAYHNYFPDFKINDIYYEIKGYFRPETEAKIQQFPEGLTLELIDEARITKYITYAKKIYGKDFYRLYDRNYPSWMDKVDKE